MEILDLITRIYQNVPLETVIQALGAAGGIGVVLQKYKKWFEVQSNGVVNFVNFVLSAVAVMIQGLLTASAQNPTMIPGKALGLMSITILLYHSVLKPISNLSSDVKSRKAQKARIEEKTSDKEDVADIDSVVPQVAPISASAPVGLTPVVSDEF